MPCGMGHDVFIDQDLRGEIPASSWCVATALITLLSAWGGRERTIPGGGGVRAAHWSRPRRTLTCRRRSMTRTLTSPPSAYLDDWQWAFWESEHAYAGAAGGAAAGCWRAGRKAGPRKSACAGPWRWSRGGAAGDGSAHADRRAGSCGWSSPRARRRSPLVDRAGDRPAGD